MCKACIGPKQKAIINNNQPIKNPSRNNNLAGGPANQVFDSICVDEETPADIRAAGNTIMEGEGGIHDSKIKLINESVLEDNDKRLFDRDERRSEMK